MTLPPPVGSSEFLNTPPMTGPPPGMPDLSDMTPEAIEAKIAQASGSGQVPVIDSVEYAVQLPAGWVSPRGDLIDTAVVKELNGYDEEKLSRIDIGRNIATFTTELLAVGVEAIGGQKPPNKELLRDLLIGDRDALVLGIRQATYGNDVELTLHCSACNNDSAVSIDLREDVPVKKPDDPMQRVFEVPLRKGSAKIQLVNGRMQEEIGDLVGKKTPAEMNTRILSRCVTEIDGVFVAGDEERIKALSAADRATLIDFLGENQPGPQLSGIKVPCATCGEEYPYTVGLRDLFRV